MKAVAVVVVVLALTGCSALQPKQKPEPAKVHSTVVTNGSRIDASGVIHELFEAGCDVSSMKYQEGMRTSSIEAACK